jgi:hypothetical protein
MGGAFVTSSVALVSTGSAEAHFLGHDAVDDCEIRRYPTATTRDHRSDPRS